jgi:hypothetical protein
VQVQYATGTLGGAANVTPIEGHGAPTGEVPTAPPKESILRLPTHTSAPPIIVTPTILSLTPADSAATGEHP